jgi:surfactin synthase thioesterase subunit
LNSSTSERVAASYRRLGPQDCSDKSWQRAASRGWTIRTFPGGHVAQQEDPRGVATLLEQSVSDKNKAPAKAGH